LLGTPFHRKVEKQQLIAGKELDPAAQGTALQGLDRRGGKARNI